MKIEDVTCDLCTRNGRCARQAEAKEVGIKNPASDCEHLETWEDVE